MQLHRFKTPETLSRAVADWLVSYVSSVLQRQDRFTIALSGGSTPQTLFELLTTDEYRSRFVWEKWHVFWGDERAVPFTDDRNNARMAYRALLDHVPVPADQIHVMRTDVDPETAAAEYEGLLHTYFDGQPTTFDLVLLGLGDDGHTLSLFPGTPVVWEEQVWVKAFFLESQAMYRITLTAPVVNRADCVAFLVAGAKKAPVLARVLRQALGEPAQSDELPAERVHPINGNLHWFVDEAAAGT